MTFTLVRLGLPNSVAILALAMVPIVSIAMAPTGRVDVAPSYSTDMTVGAGIGSAEERAQAIVE